MVIRATVRDVVDALGGVSEVARITGARPSTISAWQARLGHFPPKTYVVMTAALAARGSCAPQALWKMIEPVSGEAS